jgi:hypothetical protein
VRQLLVHDARLFLSLVARLDQPLKHFGR